MKPVRVTNRHNWYPWVFVLTGLLVPVDRTFGQGGGGGFQLEEPSITGVQLSPEARVTLQAARRGFEEQFKACEEKAEEAASRYREEMENKSPSDAKLLRLRGELEAAVRDAFKIQMLLQKTRLQLAELDLIELHNKYLRRESLAQNIIERRVLDLIGDKDLSWPSHETPEDRPDSQNPETNDDGEVQHTIPKFGSPRELLEYSRDATREGDWGTKMRRIIELMEKEEVDRFAGVCLRTASTIRSAAQVAQTFAAFGPPGQNAELMEVAKDLESLLLESRIRKPPRSARDAYEEICATDINLFQMMFSPSAAPTSRPTMDATSYSRKLRSAAQSLKDPAEFIVQFITAMQKLEAYKSDDDDVIQPSSDQGDWLIEEDGDHATVTNSSSKSMNLPMWGKGRMELVRRDNTWLISSIISDREIEELQQGLRPSSGSKKSENPSKEDQISPEDQKENAVTEEEQLEK